MKLQTYAPRGDRFGLPMILISATLWGTVGLFVQLIYNLTDTNPVSIGFLRLAISVPVLLAACIQTLKWRMFQIARRDLMLMIAVGVMTALYQVCYFSAIAYVGVATASLITLCTAPIWVALLARLLLNERLTAQVIRSGLLALIGTVLLVGIQSHQLTQQSDLIWGVLLALSSALGYASVVLCSRILSSRYHPLQSLTVGFLTGTLFLFPIALSAGLVIHYSTVGWLSLFYLGIIPTAVAYLLYFSGIRQTSATIASIATLLEPLVSTVLAWWLLQERLQPSSLLGALLLLGAIALLYRENARSGS